MKHIRLFTPLALLLILSITLSGCGALGAGQQVSAADVIAKMRETMKTTQTAQGVAELSLTINKDGIKTLMQGMMGGGANSAAPGMMGGSANSPAPGMMGGGANGVAPSMMSKDWTAQLPDSASTTIKTWKQAPDKARIEIESSTLPGVKGATLVYDGQKAYAYDAAHNTVYTATPEKIMDKLPAEIKAALQSANSTDVEKQLDKLIDSADIKLLGTEKISGIDAYKLDVKPKSDAATRLDIPQMYQMQAGLLIKDLHAVLWVDQVRWVPLKMTVEHPNIGAFTSTATELTLNKPIDASTFVLQVPAGAKTVDLDAKMQENSPQSTTLPDAISAASKEGWTLLQPSYVPTGATLIEVLRMPSHTGEMSNVTSNVSAYTLNYSSPTTSFSIMESNSSTAKMMLGGAAKLMPSVSAKTNEAAKEVDVRGVKGTAFSPNSGNLTVLAWQEKGKGISVAIHGKLSLDEALKIADGLK